jgi:hypothetical protein
MFVHEVQRFFFPERIGAPYTPQQRALATRYVTAAELRLCQARDVWSSARPVVAAVLLRESVSLLVRAAIAAHDTKTDHSTLDALDAAR